MRRAVGVNKSVNRGLPGSQGELGSKGTVSGRVKAVVGSILVAHDGNGALRSRKRRHTGSGVKKGVKKEKDRTH